jgi:hypothetical protein
MVADPVDYAWSSHHCHAPEAPDPLIIPHSALARWGAPEERQRNHRELVMQAVDSEETDTSAGTSNINVSTALTASVLRSNGGWEENSSQRRSADRKRPSAKRTIC